MTQSIRDAVQAVLDAGDMIGNVGSHARADAMRTAVARLRAALSAPQPTADERLERLLADVEMYGHAHAVETRNDAFRGHESMAGRPQYDLPAMFAEIEQSARALLSASHQSVALTDEQIIAIRKRTSPAHPAPWADSLAFARAIIAAMKETK